MNKGDVYIVEKSQNQCSFSSIQVEMDTVIERKNRRYFPDRVKKKKTAVESLFPWTNDGRANGSNDTKFRIVPSTYADRTGFLIF